MVKEDTSGLLLKMATMQADIQLLSRADELHVKEISSLHVLIQDNRKQLINAIEKDIKIAVGDVTNEIKAVIEKEIKNINRWVVMSLFGIIGLMAGIVGYLITNYVLV